MSFERVSGGINADGSDSRAKSVFIVPLLISSISCARDFCFASFDRIYAPVEFANGLRNVTFAPAFFASARTLFTCSISESGWKSAIITESFVSCNFETSVRSYVFICQRQVFPPHGCDFCTFLLCRKHAPDYQRILFIRVNEKHDMFCSLDFAVRYSYTHRLICIFRERLKIYSRA